MQYAVQVNEATLFPQTLNEDAETVVIYESVLDFVEQDLLPRCKAGLITVQEMIDLAQEVLDQE